MRIQETDRILKQARYGRQAAASQEHHEEGGIVTRALRAVTSLPNRVTALFRRH